MDPKLTTLFGAKEIEVIFDDGRKETLSVRQFKVIEYAKLLPIVTDEINLCAYACGKSRKVIESLTPASYEAIFTAVKEANEKGFFSYADRQIQFGLRSMPAAVLERAMENANPSSPPFAHLPPPAG